MQRIQFDLDRCTPPHSNVTAIGLPPVNRSSVVRPDQNDCKLSPELVCWVRSQWSVYFASKWASLAGDLPMSRGPQLQPLVLTDVEIAQLTAWNRRPKTARALAERARIILASATGAPKLTVAEAVGVTFQTVGKWRRRFLSARLDGLLDAPRAGACTAASRNSKPRSSATPPAPTTLPNRSVGRRVPTTSCRV